MWMWHKQYQHPTASRCPVPYPQYRHRYRPLDARSLRHRAGYPANFGCWMPPPLLGSEDRTAHDAPSGAARDLDLAQRPGPDDVRYYTDGDRRKDGRGRRDAHHDGWLLLSFPGLAPTALGTHEKTSLALPLARVSSRLYPFLGHPRTIPLASRLCSEYLICSEYFARRCVFDAARSSLGKSLPAYPYLGRRGKHRHQYDDSLDDGSRRMIHGRIIIAEASDGADAQHVW